MEAVAHRVVQRPAGLAVGQRGAVVQLQVLAGLRALMDAAPGPYEAVSSAEDATLDDSPPANQMRWKGVEDAAARSAFGPGVSSGRTSLDAGARM